MISATSSGEIVRKLLVIAPHKFPAMKESYGWKGKVRRKGKLGRKGRWRRRSDLSARLCLPKMFVLEIGNRGSS